MNKLGKIASQTFRPGGGTKWDNLLLTNVLLKMNQMT